MKIQKLTLTGILTVTALLAFSCKGLRKEDSQPEPTPQVFEITDYKPELEPAEAVNIFVRPIVNNSVFNAKGPFPYSGTVEATEGKDGKSVISGAQLISFVQSQVGAELGTLSSTWAHKVTLGKYPTTWKTGSKTLVTNTDKVNLNDHIVLDSNLGPMILLDASIN